MKELHQEVYLTLGRLKSELIREKNLEDATDTIGVLKKTFDMIKDLKMEVDRCTEQMEKVVCALYIRSPIMGEPIRGEWVTGSPYPRSVFKFPSMKSDPEAYMNWMRQMGVPDDVIASGAVRPHYPSMVEHLNKLEAEGKQLPQNVNPHDSGTEFGVRCVWHRDVDLDAMCVG